MAQIAPTVGDLAGNRALCDTIYIRAEAADCDLVVLPELALTGYPPEDLLLKPAFVRDGLASLAAFAANTGRCTAVVGFVDRVGDRLHNAAAVCREGRVVHVYHKRLLPNYGPFDEHRYFRPGPDPAEDPAIGSFEVGGVKCAVSVCEDIWFPDGPVAAQVAAGARVVLSINGSPFHAGKSREREAMLADRARSLGRPVVYVNQVGGQDELVFDGASVAVAADGTVAARLAAFEAEFAVVTVDPVSGSVVGEIGDHPDDLDLLHRALVTGTRDYVRKNGFTDVVIGLSGGIDSSLVAAIAVEALGSDHVHGVAMPSRFSSEGSLRDAAALARNLGIDHRTVSIEPAFAAYLSMLEESFAGRDPDVTEENLQSRCRGTMLMALSNKFGWMVLTTGNKSEMAVGYFTIYGDSAGGFATIKDVFKTDVYALCERINGRAGRDIIPRHVIDKPPSAELRPDQLDSDSLPPYEALDPILRLYVDGDMTVPEIVAAGHPPDVVGRIARLVDTSEYKRRQSAPGVRVSTKAFGRDRRMPITNLYR
jgi:NAD+ synthase (glutamine-hydrolysing)